MVSVSRPFAGGGFSKDFWYFDTKMYERLVVGQVLLIAEDVLGEPAERLHATISLWRIEAALAAPFVILGGTEVYPDPLERAAICGALLVRNRPFPRGNKQIAYLVMREMLERGGVPWPLSGQSQGEFEDLLAELERGRLSEEEFVAWMKGGGRE